MGTWKRFWMAAIGWSAALVALLVSYAVALHFSTDSYHGPGALVLSLHAVGRMVGLFFPLIAFFAALRPGPLRGSQDPPNGAAAFAAAPIAAGAVVYLWLAFVEPWTNVLIFRWTAELAGVAIQFAPVASTQLWLAAQLANPGVEPADNRFFTWLFHLPNAMGLLTALLVVAGFLVRPRAATASQRWTMAALVSVVVAPMLLGSLRLSITYEVPPQATTYGMLLIPLFLLALLGWIGWTERERPPFAVDR